MDRPATGIGLDTPIMHDSDRYDFVRDIGSGNFGVARLMRDKQTQELVAVKYIERGEKVCVNSSFLSEEGIGFNFGNMVSEYGKFRIAQPLKC
ncbi:hypothetical protein LR48_Vigan06g036200 [Vigna angularis]|uniref:Protein kinase domain-containing protein n=1 Tax=Phaseolus angularis TaxID=3914 RepID=A0A0L9UQT7_PHAAN|nr:hypothetical protein LR48_Vigan06g036200 [Vigna angularis]